MAGIEHGHIIACREGIDRAEQGQEANRFIITRNEDTFGRIGFSASLDDENVAFNYCEVSDVDYEISFDEDEYPAVCVETYSYQGTGAVG